MNKETQCNLCTNTICFETMSDKGKVLVDTNPKHHVIRGISKGTIKDCAVKRVLEEKQQDDIEDIRNY